MPRHDGNVERSNRSQRSTGAKRSCAKACRCCSAVQGALRLVIDRLKTKYVPVRDEQAFANVNTPDDYAKLRNVIA